MWEEQVEQVSSLDASVDEVKRGMGKGKWAKKLKKKVLTFREKEKCERR